MYHWIEDTKFLGMMHRRCAEVVNWLVQDINNDGFMNVKQHLVGSGAKNLILQNENESIDLDYNLEIIRCEDFNNCRKIKDTVMKVFNSFLPDINWGYCKDSTSVITTEKIHFEGDGSEFSIDIAITCKDQDGNWYRLIHDKSGLNQKGYKWEQAKDSKDLENRVYILKKHNCWGEVRNTYKYKKNMYLCRYDRNDHSSFNVYIETINEIYGKYFY